MDYLFAGSGSISIPRNIGKAFMIMKNGYMYIEPPTPVIQKQTFPIGENSGVRVYEYFISGSGSGIAKEMELLYPSFFIPFDISCFTIKDLSHSG